MYYRTLYAAWGRQNWWPARSPVEVIVGAYLTQNTAWRNVEIALRCLRRERLLSLRRLRTSPLRQLERAIRSAGYFRTKARSLKTFVALLDARHGGSLKAMFAPTRRYVNCGKKLCSGRNRLRQRGRPPRRPPTGISPIPPLP
jgi:endonuclease-3 related protein